MDEAFADDGALHREWPSLVVYVARRRERGDPVDLDDARAFVQAVREAVDS